MVFFASFNDHIYFNNFQVYFLLCCLWLKSFLWFPNCSLKVVAARLKYIYFSLFTSFSTFDLYLGFGADSEEDKHFSLGFKITKYGCNCRVKNTCPLYTLDLRIVMVPDDCIIAWNFKWYIRVFLHSCITGFSILYLVYHWTFNTDCASNK